MPATRSCGNRAAEYAHVVVEIATVGAVNVTRRAVAAAEVGPGGYVLCVRWA